MRGHIKITLSPLSLSSFLSNSNCLSVLVKPLNTRYSLIASSRAPTAVVMAFVLVALEQVRCHVCSKTRLILLCLWTMTSMTSLTNICLCIVSKNCSSSVVYVRTYVYRVSFSVVSLVCGLTELYRASRKVCRLFYFVLDVFRQ